MIPAPRKVLVIEHRHGFSTRPKHLKNLRHEFVPRIKSLSLFVPWISSVLAHHHHSVHRQFAGAAGESLRDGRIHFHPGKSLGALISQVRTQLASIALIHVEGNQIHGGMMMLAIPPISFQKTVHDMLPVRQLLTNGDNGGDFWTSRCRAHREADLLRICEHYNAREVLSLQRLYRIFLLFAAISPAEISEKARKLHQDAFV